MCSSWIQKRQRSQRSNCQHPLDHQKAREFQKNIYFCFIDYIKAFNCVDHNKLWKILQEMGIPDHMTCLLRNLFAGQEATVRTGHGTMDYFLIGKGACQGHTLSPCLFNVYAQRNPAKLPEVMGTSRGNPGFPATPRERPREFFLDRKSTRLNSSHHA